MIMADKNEKPDFEKSMETLEKIVESLEGGDLSLDQALKKYEEGVGLVRVCQSRLAEAEKKIEVLTKTLDGSFEKAPFGDVKPSVKNKKKGGRSGDRAA